MARVTHRRRGATTKRIYMARAGATTAAFLQPGSIIVPTEDNGRPTYRLDMLAPTSGFNHAHAHDALSDTEAVVQLA